MLGDLSSSSVWRSRPIAVAGTLLSFLLLILIIVITDELSSPVLVVAEHENIEEYRLDTQKKQELYKQWTLFENQKHFTWNLRSTKIIFWVSMLTTMSGIAFAFWQFAEASIEERSAGLQDELELKTQLISLAFKTRSVAALVLFVSLAYLLIYVIFVYPMRSIPTFGQTAHGGDMVENSGINKTEIEQDRFLYKDE